MGKHDGGVVRRRQPPQASGIVYALSRDNTREVAQYLVNSGFVLVPLMASLPSLNIMLRLVLLPPRLRIYVCNHCRSFGSLGCSGNPSFCIRSKKGTAYV